MAGLFYVPLSVSNRLQGRHVVFAEKAPSPESRQG